ncbi:MAG: S41 family peptidase [Hyphomicrobiaceae bacterium]
MTQPTIDKARIERLAALGRLWGTIKFFHPALAYRDIDWDGALIAAIPKVRAAKTAKDFRAAVDEMLAALNDPATRTVLQPKPPEKTEPTGAGAPKPTGGAAPAGFLVADGVVVVDAAARALLEQNADPAEAELASAALTAELAKAKGIVIDLRLPADSDEMLAYFVIFSVRAIIARQVKGPVTLGVARYRQHYGYAAQSGLPSGNYAASLVAEAPNVLSGRRTSDNPPPLALVVPSAFSSMLDVAVGLQAAGLASIVEEIAPAGTPPPPPWALDGHRLELSDGIAAIVRIGEIVAPDGRIGLTPDARIPAHRDGSADAALDAAVKLVRQPPQARAPMTAAAAVPRPSRDNPYPDMTFPGPEHRLLALFRLWHVTNNFFPYAYLMDRPWDEALLEFIPRFEDNKTALDYQLTVMELAARLQDSHVGVYNAQVAEEHLGLYVPPILVTAIEGQTVAAALPEPASAHGIRVGDTIVAVDGEPVEDRRTRLARLVASSTPQALRRNLEPMLLRGAKDSVAKLRIKDATGTISEIDVPRTLEWAKSGDVQWLPGYRKTPDTFTVLPSGYGYIDLARLRPVDVDTALDAVFKTPAIIFDMRGYPHGTAWSIAPRLVKQPPKKPVVGAVFLPPFWKGATRHKLSFEQPLPETDKPRYQGKVVVLIDEWAISQAEHTCLMFSAATDVTFVGSATTGANGDITNMVLPGNLFVGFTGQEVRFADGRQLQRVGVLPHVPVAPTIAGIRAGRGEVLEAAIGHLERSKK